MRKLISTILFLAVLAGLIWGLVFTYRFLIAPLFAPPPPPPPPEEKTVIIREGATNLDIANYFEELGLFSAADFLNLAGSAQSGQTGDQAPDLSVFKERFTWLSTETQSLEGYLFPDTYRVFASSTPNQIIIKMLENFERRLDSDLRAEITASGRTLQEILILASIIEKEAPIDYRGGNDEDARLIAGVFKNRLDIGQALQADATLSYIFQDNKPQHSGEELTVDSPYNTYKYPGLPPGPISNPGLLAIKAAVQPAKTNYYYFLTPTGSREVIYARSYNEHLQNKYKYLR